MRYVELHPVYLALELPPGRIAILRPDSMSNIALAPHKLEENTSKANNIKDEILVLMVYSLI